MLYSRLLGDTALPTLEQAVGLFVSRLYAGLPLPPAPLDRNTPTKYERNAAIRRRYAAGDSLTQLAADYSLTIQRVHQIVRNAIE